MIVLLSLESPQIMNLSEILKFPDYPLTIFCKFDLPIFFAAIAAQEVTVTLYVRPSINTLLF